MGDDFLDTPIQAVRARSLAELKEKFANAEAAMEAGDYGLALVMAGDREPEIYASALTLCGAIDEGLSLLDNLKAESVHSRWVRAYAAWTKGDIEVSIRHLSTLRGSPREPAALKLIELIKRRPLEIGVFSTIHHPGAEALGSNDDFNIRKFRLAPEQVGSAMAELGGDLDKHFDFIINLDAYGAHLPSDFHALDAPKIFYVLDHDGLISTRHFDIARADTVIVTGSNEHDELERVYSRRVSSFLGYDVYQSARDYEPPLAPEPNEIDWDILVTGRTFTPYYNEKAVTMFALATLEDPELKICVVQGVLPWADYRRALRSCAATIVSNRMGSIFSSRGAEALRLGCQVLHFDGEACASLAKFMGGGVHSVEKNDLAGAICKARDTWKNWAEDRSRSGVRHNILDVFPNSPEREIRLIKFGIFENALNPGQSPDSSLPAATWVPAEHQTYSYNDGLTVFTRIATINLKAPDKTAVHLNNAGAALTYAALFHDGTGKFLQRALAVYETAVATYPDHLVSHFNRGRIFWLAGKRDLAVKELIWVADMAADATFDPSVETILSHRIHNLNEMCPYGHYWRAASEAIAVKDESFEKPRRIIQATASAYLAQDCFERGDFDGARIQALKATRLFPDHFPALVLLARTDLELGDFYEEGVAAFRRAFSVYPVIINNYLSVGVALEEQVSSPERALHLVRQWSLFRLRVRTEKGELWPASGETIETFERYYENLPAWIRARMTREGEAIQEDETTMSFEQKMEKTRYTIAPYLKEYDGIKMYWQPFVMTQTTPDYRSDVVNTDSLGFRYSRDQNGREVHFDNSRDCKVNLFVGNSTAFGVGVTSDEKTLPSLLAKSTKETWLNLSFRTHTIRQNFITFSSVRDLIGPINNIVLFAGATDLLIYLINSLLPKPWGTFYHYANYFEKFYNVPPGFLSRIENHYRERKCIVDQVRLDLSNWKVMASGLGAQLLFVYQPIAELSCKKQSAEEIALYEAIENSPHNPYSGDLKLSFFKANKWFRAALNESCVILDIPYLDANTFNAGGSYHGEWLFTDPFHLNDRGSEVIADLITEMILKSPEPEKKK